MAKLRNYEIDALHNVVCKRVSALKEAKIAEIKKTVVLDGEDRLLLSLVKEYEALNQRRIEISELGEKLSKKIFKTNPLYWVRVTEDDILKNKAEKQLPEKLARPYCADIKDKLIVANIDGNIENIIENIVAEYND